MIHVEWKELQLTAAQRAHAEERIERIAVGPADVFTVRRVVHGYQAILAKTSPARGTELRFHGGDLMEVLERALELSSIVAREASRTGPRRSGSSTKARSAERRPAPGA